MNEAKAKGLATNVIAFPNSHPRILQYSAKKSFFSRGFFRRMMTIAAIRLRQQEIYLTFTEEENLLTSTFLIKVTGSNSDISWFEDQLKSELS